MMRSLFRPIDSAILIYFRIGAGILISQELINQIMIGKFKQYISTSYHFPYMYFEWVRPWPYWGLVIHYAVTIFAGFAVAFNFHYRVFSKILFIGFTYLFLCDQTEYINHTYLYCLITFWLMFLPLHRKSPSQPAWMLYLILFHISLAYFFGGIAKLNPDWLSGTPMDIFLAKRSHMPLGFLYSQSWAPLFFSYGGVLFDLLIVPLMLLRQTRRAGMGLAIVFHVSNMQMFGLATFPWFSLLVTSMFFDPSWPRKVPFLRKIMPWGVERLPDIKPNGALVWILGVYVLIHLALPLRQLLYPGNTSWTEQGHMFAWRMMLRDKKGSLRYFVLNRNSGKVVQVNPLDHITERQLDDILGKPDLILAFAHYLERHYKNIWSENVSVYASARVSLNGRPLVEMIALGTDLTREERTIAPYKWVNISLPERNQKNFLSLR